MSETIPALRIDIVSDIVCPWCVVGYRQLAEALKQTHTAHEIHWHPFELNPDMPAEGQNLREHIMEKYGSSQQESDASRVRITEAGAEVGFEFNFTDDTRMHNTFKAHQLLHWAADYGLKHELKQALFTAHFTDNRNISDEEVLADIAEDVGLDQTVNKLWQSLLINVMLKWYALPSNKCSNKAFKACLRLSLISVI